MADAKRHFEKAQVRQTLPLDPAEKKLMEAHCARQVSGSNARFICAAMRILNRLPEDTVDMLCAFAPSRPLWDDIMAKMIDAVGGKATPKTARKRG